MKLPKITRLRKIPNVNPEFKDERVSAEASAKADVLRRVKSNEEIRDASGASIWNFTFFILIPLCFALIGCGRKMPPKPAEGSVITYPCPYPKPE